MVGRFSMTTRGRARAAMRGMAAGAAGPRLRSRWRRISAGRIAHICLRTVEFAAALFIVGGLVLASVLARGPIRLVGLHDQIEASLKERVGDSYALSLRPDLPHARFLGGGSGIQGPDAARCCGSNGPVGPERQGRPRPVRAGDARREGPPARARRARPAPAGRRRRRPLACGRERFRRDPNSAAGRDARGSGARPTSPPSSASPPRPWPAPPRPSTG